MAAIESWRTSMSQELMALTINMPAGIFPIIVILIAYHSSYIKTKIL